MNLKRFSLSLVFKLTPFGLLLFFLFTINVFAGFGPNREKFHCRANLNNVANHSPSRYDTEAVTTYKRFTAYGPLPRLSGRDISGQEELLRTGHIIERTPIIEYVDLVLLDNGVSAVFKYAPDSWKYSASAEVLAYELDRLLTFNLVPPTVLHSIYTDKGSLQLFVNSSTEINETHYKEISKQRLFDFIIDNKDRNQGNFLGLKNGKIASIDHGMGLSDERINKSFTFWSAKDQIDQVLESPSGKTILQKLIKYEQSRIFKKETSVYIGEENTNALLIRMKFIIDYQKAKLNSNSLGLIILSMLKQDDLNQYTVLQIINMIKNSKEEIDGIDEIVNLLFTFSQPHSDLIGRLHNAVNDYPYKI